MNVCVLGLTHLGTVTAVCLAACGHDVTGLDVDAPLVQRLGAGAPPVYEPGLEDLLQRMLAEGRLRFTTDAAGAIGAAEVVWIAYDTPVDDEDRADVAFVVDRVCTLFPLLRAQTLVLVSSQVPVGTTRYVEETYQASHPYTGVTFGYTPENLRLGQAIETFLHPARVVVGVRSPADQERVRALLAPLNCPMEWMSVESAEMTKHALNAFLATSVAFMNEVATLCEAVGADAKEVERGLKSEPRIGPRAYLAPGAAFAGGTLARDLQFLTQLGARYDRPTLMLAAVHESNQAHKAWARRTLAALSGTLRGRRIAIWGLAYKPGTDSVRRSIAVELCEWLAQQGAQVHAHDGAVAALPDTLAHSATLHRTPLDAAAGATALVVATPWPEYQGVTADEVVSAMETPVIIDPGRHLGGTLGADARIRYFAVGKPPG